MLGAVHAPVDPRSSRHPFAALPLVVVAAAALAGQLAVVPTAVAGGFGIPEVGTRRTAMASVIGRPDEAAAIFHNPAGLALLPGVRLYTSMGLSLLDADFRLRPWEGSEGYVAEPLDADGYYPTVEPTRAFGVIPMLAGTVEILRDELWAGAAIYVSNGTGSSFADGGPARYHLLDGYVISPLGALAVAWRPRPWLAVAAAGGVVNVRIHGRRRLYPLLPDDDDPDDAPEDYSSFLGPDSELVMDGSAWAPTWNTGVLVFPSPRVSIGATVIGRADATVEGPVTIDTPTRLFEGTQRTRMLLPWTFQGGVHVDVHRWVELGLELRYWLYRQYDEQLTEVSGVGFVEELRTPKDYHDSFQVSGGARVHDLPPLPGLELMLGAHRDESPAPPQTISFEQPTFDHVGLHSGLRYTRGRYRAGATYIHYWYDVPTVSGSLTTPPSNFAGRGENNIFTLTLEVAWPTVIR